MAHPFTVVSALLDAAVFVSLLLNERHQARRNGRPARRWLVLVTGGLAGAAIVLAVLASVPL